MVTLKRVHTAHGDEEYDKIVRHGVAVVINVPAAFRSTARAKLQRRLDAAAALGVDVPALAAAGAFAQQRPLGRV